MLALTVYHAQAMGLAELTDDALGAVAGQAGLTVTINNSAPVTAAEAAVQDDGNSLRAQGISWKSITSTGAASTSSSPVIIKTDVGTAGGYPHLKLDTDWARRRLQIDNVRVGTGNTLGAMVLDAQGSWLSDLYYQGGTGYRLNNTLTVTDAALFWRDGSDELVLNNLNLALALPDTVLTLDSGTGLRLAGTTGTLNLSAGRIWLQSDAGASYSRASPGTSLGGFGLQGSLGAYSLTLRGPGQLGSQGLTTDYSLSTASGFIGQWHSGGSDSLWLTGQHSLAGKLLFDVGANGNTTGNWTWNGSSLALTLPATAAVLGLRNGSVNSTISRVSLGNGATANAPIGGARVNLSNINADLGLTGGGYGGDSSGLTLYPLLSLENSALYWTDNGLGLGAKDLKFRLGKTSGGSANIDLNGGQLTFRLNNSQLLLDQQVVASTNVNDAAAAQSLFGLRAELYGNLSIGLKAPTDGRPLLQMPLAFSLDNNPANEIRIYDTDGTPGTFAFKNWSGLAMTSSDARIGVENGQFVVDTGQLVHQTDARVQEIKVGNGNLGQLFMPAQSSLHTAVKVWGH